MKKYVYNYTTSSPVYIRPYSRSILSPVLIAYDNIHVISQKFPISFLQ